MTTDQPTQLDQLRAAVAAELSGAGYPTTGDVVGDVRLLLNELDAAAGLHQRIQSEAAQAQAVIDATRQMAIDANARLRAQLLAALDREDDGRTPLSTYVSHLVAQRDALKWSVGKAADEEERLRTDMAFAREEAKSIYDTCKQIERERDTMREVARGNKRHVATLSVLLERVEKLTVSTDGDDLADGAEIPVGEIRRAIQEPIAGEVGAR